MTAGSNRPVWWRCEKGHSYRVIIAQRVQQGNGCPYCANRKVLVGFNDLATVQPLVAKEWHESLNGADAGDGDCRKPQKSVVTMSLRPHVASGHLRPHRRAAKRLPRLRREDKNQ